MTDTATSARLRSCSDCNKKAADPGGAGISRKGNNMYFYDSTNRKICQIKGVFKVNGKDICKYLDSMSQYQQESLAAAALDLLNGILAQPGGRELLDRKKAELYAEGRL